MDRNSLNLRQRASDCLNLAKYATTPTYSRVFEELACHWTKMADEWDQDHAFLDKLDNLVTGLNAPSLSTGNGGEGEL
jgi:hypothetical protein